MKSSLSTILLLIATFTSATPVPSRSSRSASPPDCALTSCNPSLTRFINKSPSSTRRKSYSFSSKSSDHLKITISITEKEETPSRKPFRASKHHSTTESLASDKPLSSSYLQSVGHKYPEVKALEDKVSSYLSTHPASSSSSSSRKPSVAAKKPCRPQHMYLPGNVYITTHAYVSRNPDIVVIGVVLVFLLGILAVECAERVAKVFGRKKSERGEVYPPVEKQGVVVAYNDVKAPIDCGDEERSIEPEEWEVVSASEGDAVEVERPFRTHV